MLRPSALPSLDKEVVPSTLMMCGALGLRDGWQTVHILLLTTVSTLKMLVFAAKACYTLDQLLLLFFTVFYTCMVSLAHCLCAVPRVCSGHPGRPATADGTLCNSQQRVEYVLIVLAFCTRLY